MYIMYTNIYIYIYLHYIHICKKYIICEPLIALSFGLILFPFGSFFFNFVLYQFGSNEPFRVTPST